MTYNILIKNSIDFTDVPPAHISTYKWTEGYTPKAEGRLIFVPGVGFCLRMSAEEAEPKTTYTDYNDPVYKDSCLEFFVSFVPDKKLYMNFEMNSAGAFLAAVRENRSEKTPIHVLTELPSVRAWREGNKWTVQTIFDGRLIRDLFGVGIDAFGDGSIIKGNFYKCGDDTDVPHFGMWSEILSEKADFHRPEFFGTMILKG